MPRGRKLSKLFRGVIVRSEFHHRWLPQKRDGVWEVAGGMGSGGGDPSVG